MSSLRILIMRIDFSISLRRGWNCLLSNIWIVRSILICPTMWLYCLKIAFQMQNMKECFHKRSVMTYISKAGERSFIQNRRIISSIPLLNSRRRKVTFNYSMAGISKVKNLCLKSLILKLLHPDQMRKMKSLLLNWKKEDHPLIKTLKMNPIQKNRNQK